MKEKNKSKTYYQVGNKKVRSASSIGRNFKERIYTESEIKEHKESVINLSVIIRASIDFGFSMSREYSDKEKTIKWIDRKQSMWMNIKNPFMRNKYYYGILFTKRFIDSFSAFLNSETSLKIEPGELFYSMGIWVMDERNIIEELLNTIKNNSK